MAILKTSGLTKSFGNLRAVRDVCFEVREGEIYGLLGPNGAGKTTTISMISGLLKPDAGQVVADGDCFRLDENRGACDANRVGHGFSAPAHQLRRRTTRRSCRDGGPAGFRSRVQRARREIFPMLEGAWELGTDVDPCAFAPEK
ncbi:MAG: ATP-binding cassette domain-containing protein [Verrucomicrobia bacterium]|nr:ATP-binding cassette domain-containing protein [Verrucomicrobiota bacterium]